MQKMEESTVSINTRIKEQSFGRDIACDPQLYNELLWDSARQVEMIAALFQEGSETGTKSVVIAQLKNLYRQEKAILCAIKRLLENECPMEEKFCLHSDILRNVSNSDDKCVPQFFSKRDIELEPFEN